MDENKTPPATFHDTSVLESGGNAPDDDKRLEETRRAAVEIYSSKQNSSVSISAYRSKIANWRGTFLHWVG